jgi:hypothetical protein
MEDGIINAQDDETCRHEDGERKDVRLCQYMRKVHFVDELTKLQKYIIFSIFFVSLHIEILTVC